MLIQGNLLYVIPGFDKNDDVCNWKLSMNHAIWFDFSKVSFDIFLENVAKQIKRHQATENHDILSKLKTR